MLPGFFLIALLCAPQPLESMSERLPDGLYAGNSVTIGAVRVPFVGRKETRTEAFSLARVSSNGSRMVVREEGCAIVIGTVSGVKATMRDETVAHLPGSVIRFQATERGSWRSEPWRVRWDEEDLDRDGKPGATVVIRAPLCSGEVYIASDTTSRAEGRVRQGRLEGDVDMRVHQRVLDASRRCLRWISSDSVDDLRGSFRYVPVPEGTTCQELLSGPWPGRLASGE